MCILKEFGERGAGSVSVWGKQTTWQSLLMTKFSTQAHPKHNKQRKKFRDNENFVLTLTHRMLQIKQLKREVVKEMTGDFCSDVNRFSV